ncbi:hypothetical protein CDAR_186771 [Caerostris darwini]|uniref:Secreted protein n=1 Tax=Caerostris darwini TaxID=1538125 RepID=A0AAV4PR75_9ARAC|nr:hypothetical protein CDAR_186771 [Caerostris darwini]
MVCARFLLATRGRRSTTPVFSLSLRHVGKHTTVEKGKSWIEGVIPLHAKGAKHKKKEKEEGLEEEVDEERHGCEQEFSVNKCWAIH